MSKVIEYEYVTGGPLKGGQPASKGGANAPAPPPPLIETLCVLSGLTVAINALIQVWLWPYKLSTTRSVAQSAFYNLRIKLSLRS